MDSLKPCPFSGGEVLLCYRSAEKKFVVTHRLNAPFCHFDDLKIKCDEDCGSLRQAKEAWNRRANE